MQSQNSNEKLFVRCGGYRLGLLLAVLLVLAPAFSSPQAMAGDGEVWCGFDELGVEIPCGQPGGKSSANRLRDLGAMAGHLVTSHTGSLLFRPLRSTRDLIFLATNSVRDFAQGTSRDIIRFATAGRQAVPPVVDQPGMDLVAWESRLDRLTGSSATSGSLEFLIDGEEYFPRFIDAINQAEKSVKIRTYIFDNDDYALKIADLLKKRSEDVRVAILLDGIGTLAGAMARSESQPPDYQPPRSIKRYLKHNSEVEVRVLPNIWLAGDHTKTIVIDDRQAFLGGMNIGREYRYDWHDMMVEMKGPVVKALQRDFDETWAQNGPLGDLAFLIPHRSNAVDTVGESGVPLRLLYTKAHDSQIYRAQLEAIRRARSHIYIQNAYFSDDAILHALIEARRRGVDVRVILPSQNDNYPMDRSNATAVNVLFRHGIRVYIYPGMSHIKAAIYDGWACFGSANFDKMSLRVNKEVNIGTSNHEIVSSLRDRVFMEDFSKSVEVSEEFSLSLSDHVYERVADIVL